MKNEKAIILVMLLGWFASSCVWTSRAGAGDVWSTVAAAESRISGRPGLGPSTVLQCPHLWSVYTCMGKIGCFTNIGVEDVDFL